MKMLDCNDECLRLQRNHKLAMALNINPETHMDDHIPYSQQTLDMFKDQVKFCQTYEREFRVFAADETEKRFRFKPMQEHQRAFLHSLAKDFGLDSESQDPEPHRHVSIFKTPRFVSAPMKTLGQCIKIKPTAIVEPAPSKGPMATTEPFNAFLLSSPRFGLTIDELYADIQPDFSIAGLNFGISFLPSSEIVIKARATDNWHQKTEATLLGLKPAMTEKIKSLALASTVSLCNVDPSLNVVRREDDQMGGGWSQVAKGAAPARSVQQAHFGAKSSFTVLGSKAAARRKREVVDAVDDWESTVDEWDNKVGGC